MSFKEAVQSPRPQVSISIPKGKEHDDGVPDRRSMESLQTKRPRVAKQPAGLLCLPPANSIWKAAEVDDLADEAEDWDDEDIDDSPLSKLSIQKASRAPRKKRSLEPDELEEFDPKERLPEHFHEDYFTSPGISRVPIGFEGLLEFTSIKGKQVKKKQKKLLQSDIEQWTQDLLWGFSVLVGGWGSKFEALKALANHLKEKEQWSVMQMRCFHPEFNLEDCLGYVMKNFVEQDGIKMGPEPTQPEPTQARGKLAYVVQKIKGACQLRLWAKKPPLCLIVHNIECLSASHQKVLADLVSGVNSGIHLAASYDNMTLVDGSNWDGNTRAAFNFCFAEYHGFKEYTVENEVKYGDDLPQYIGLATSSRSASSTSLALVLKSLTPNHRDVVKEIAKAQLEKKTGISQVALFKITYDKMIIRNQTTLTQLLNELVRHKTVEVKAFEGSTLYCLPHDQMQVEKLSKGDFF